MEKIDLSPYLAGQSHALVEAGHIYAGDVPDDEVKLGLMIGAAVVETLNEMGLMTDTMLFVDNYNGKGSIEDTLNAMAPILASSGFQPEHIVFEKDLVSKARELKYSRMKTKSNGKGTFAIVGSEIIYLDMQDMWGGTKITCQALDAALYLQKAEQTDGGLLVTILPISYKEQQKKTKKLVRWAGCKVPILDVYFTKNAEISVDFDY